MDRVRVDRWLWAARFFKTRSTATDAVLGGRVHVNGARVKPSKELRPGDRLEVTVGDVRRDLVVRGVAEKRGPASVAATLYEETPESAARREQLALERLLLADPQLAEATVRRELGPLLADERFGGELIETLQAYFDASENVTAAARRLNLATRTVAYRLEKIESLLGHPLDGDQGRRLSTALMVQRLRSVQ